MCSSSAAAPHIHIYIYHRQTPAHQAIPYLKQTDLSNRGWSEPFKTIINYSIHFTHINYCCFYILYSKSVSLSFCFNFTTTNIYFTHKYIYIFIYIYILLHLHESISAVLDKEKIVVGKTKEIHLIPKFLNTICKYNFKINRKFSFSEF